jgi:hypothetical protein
MIYPKSALSKTSFKYLYDITFKHGGAACTIIIDLLDVSGLIKAEGPFLRHPSRLGSMK